MSKQKVTAEQLQVMSCVHEKNNVPEKRKCGQPALARSSQRNSFLASNTCFRLELCGQPYAI